VELPRGAEDPEIVWVLTRPASGAKKKAKDR